MLRVGVGAPQQTHLRNFLIEPRLASDLKLAHIGGCCGSRDGEQPRTFAHLVQGAADGGELRQAAGAAAPV
jgi:hypothetical protein